MTNELIFIIHTSIISLFTVFALKLRKEALVAFLSIQAILSNLLVSKQIVIWGLCATCSDAFSVGAGLTLNLLQEYYGKNNALRAIWISFFGLFFYLIMTQVHIAYLPGIEDIMQEHFKAIFEFMPRLVIASLVTYLISQRLESWLYDYFRKKFHAKFFIIRNYTSLFISQFVDTGLFTILGLYGLMPNLWQIFVVSYGVKVITILVSAPIVGLCKQIFKPKE